MQASEIIIVPDNHFTGSDVLSTFSINDDFDKNVVISPNHEEHFLSSELFEFQLHCKQNKIKVSSFGRFNYFPFYSIFSDEIILSSNHPPPGWYDDLLSLNEIDNSLVKDLKIFVDIDGYNGSGFKSYRQANNFEFSASEIAEAVWCRKIYIQESTYLLFQKHAEDLPKNIIVCEVKPTIAGEGGAGSDTVLLKHKLHQLPNVVGGDYMFQQILMNITKDTNYLGFQILCSLLLGWTYACVGGAANLFSMLPVRSILLSDYYMTPKSAEIFRMIAKKQYGEFGETYPIIAHSKYSEDIIPKIDFDKFYEASQFLSQLPPPPIRYYRRPRKIILF